MSDLVDNRNLLPGRASDFWTTRTARAQRTLIYGLLRLPWETSAPARLGAFFDSALETAQQLLPYDSAPLLRNQMVQLGLNWQPHLLSKVRLLGDDTIYTFARYDATDAQGFNSHFVVYLSMPEPGGALEILELESAPATPLLFPGEADGVSPIDPAWLVPRWLLPVPQEWAPHALQGTDRRLLLGIDYFGGDGVLVLREHPDESLPGLFGYGVPYTRPFLFDFIYHSNAAGPVLHRFIRQVQTPKLLEAAVAQVAGLQVAEEDTYILQRIDQPDGSTTYLHERGVWHLRYAHEKLNTGDTVPQYDNVGGHIRVWHGEPDTLWWRALDWSDGLDLAQICAVPGVTVPDRFVRVRTVGTDATTGKPLVELDLDFADAAAEARYWAFIRMAERITNVWLCDLCEVTEHPLSAPRQIQALEFYFAQVLAGQLVVIDLRTQLISANVRARALAFIEQHRLTGGALYVRES
jgi:hypothetical protein